MAVYEKTYRRYEGELTPRWSRFLVLSRYAKAEVFRTRFVTAFFALCFAPILAGLVLVYLHHNVGALALMDLDPRELLPIDAKFFSIFLVIQGFAAYLLTVFSAPGMVSPDLAHQALPLYLSRPFSRAEYVLGKVTVLVVLLSLVTWVPLLLLYFLQVQLEGGSWLADNVRIGWALFAGSWIWILLLSLLGLALSALAKWRTAAAALLFAVFFVGQVLSGLLTELFQSSWGQLFHVGDLIRNVWAGLFFGRQAHDVGLPLWGSWVALAAVCLFCLYLLHRKLRAYEVVK